jgi:hypothetical protein
MHNFDTTFLFPFFEVRHPRCISQITKYKVDTFSLNVQPENGLFRGRNM